MSTQFEHKYCKLVQNVKYNGLIKEGRNGYTRSLFGGMLKLDMAEEGFPILQGRKIHYKGVFGEVAAMLANAQSVDEFKQYGCNYWDKWADTDGKLNLDYGRLLRNFNGVDQLEELKKTLRDNPNSRRMIVSVWKPDNLDSLSLPCCHTLYQFYVRDGILDTSCYLRSVDLMVGLPSDMIYMATLNRLLANELGMAAGELTFMFGDIHIYEKHIPHVELYLMSALPITFKAVNITIKKGATVDNFTNDMIEPVGYNPLTQINFTLEA